MTRTTFHSDDIEREIEHAIEERLEQHGDRFGYVIAAAINGALLWIVHQLLDWEWPGFLTPDFEDLLPILTMSFVAGIAVNVVYVVSDHWPIKPLGELTTSAIGFAVTLRTWQIFPFDFNGTDWSWLARLVLALGMIGTSIAVIVQLVALVNPPSRGSRRE